MWIWVTTIQEMGTSGNGRTGKEPAGAGDSRPWGAVQVSTSQVSSGQHSSECSPCQHKAGTGALSPEDGPTGLHQRIDRGAWSPAWEGNRGQGTVHPTHAGCVIRMRWRVGTAAYPHQMALALPPMLTLAWTWVTRLSLGASISSPLKWGSGYQVHRLVIRLI